MGYLGYKPADKPLTSADITDSIITSAKITDATIVNGDIANATIALAKLSATGTPSATTFLRGDNSWNSVTTSDEYFLYKVTSDQSISNATTTKVQLGTSVISNANFDSTTNYRYTVPSGKAGKYFIAISGNWLTAGDFNNCAVYAYVNGTQKLASNIVQEHYENNYHAKIISLSVGDYVEMYCRQESGGTISFRDSGSDSPNGYMMGYRIGA